MSDPSYPLYPVFSLLGFILVLIPLPWHLQALNSGTCLFMIWTALGCLNQAINSIVWHANALDKAPIWCDISSRFMVGLLVAIPASLLCISRRLYRIASVQTVHITQAQKRRAIMVDMVIGLGIPIVQMALQIVVEGHRYNIFEDAGCYPALFHTPLAYPITLVWPIIIGLVSGVYSVLTLRIFIRRRAQFAQLFASNTSITMNRYIRLMALSLTEVLFNTPISAVCLALNYLDSPMEPWKGWADAHFDYSAVDLVPSLLWRKNFILVLTIELDRWLPVFCAFIFFGFFGFADEARRSYGILYRSITKRLRLVLPTGFDSTRPKGSPSLAATNSRPNTLPIYLPPLDLSKRDSLTSTIRPSSMGKSDASFYDSPMTHEVKMESLPSSAVPPSPTSLHSTQDDVIDIINHPSLCSDNNSSPCSTLPSTHHFDPNV